MNESIKKTLFDLLIGAVVGGGLAALDVTDGTGTAREAAGAIFGGAILGAHRAAREILKATLFKLRAPE